VIITPGRRHALAPILLAILALMVAPLVALIPARVAHAATSAAALMVQGNHLIDTNTGLPIQLRGVDRSGTEYACVQGFGIFDGPSDAASIQAMTTWHINAVRVPLNEDCWLGINRVRPAYSRSNYQQAIANYVNLLNTYGLVAILDLHWSAPGRQQATGQQPMPDEDHSVTFWSQVAAAYKGNPSVAFDLFNEPYPAADQDSTAAWQCWLNGGTCSGVPFQAAGMRQLVGTVRNTGANNVILLGGVQYANALDQWLAYKPADPANNLAASWHVYDFNPCITTTCWNNTVAPVAQTVPVVVGEFGEKNQGPQFIWGGATNPTVGLLPWIDQQSGSISYVGWTWDAWNSWDSLIAGTGSNAYYNPVPNGGTFNGVVAYGLTYYNYLTR
jgi:endoglucanase